MQKTARGTVLSIVSEGLVIRSIWEGKVLLLIQSSAVSQIIKAYSTLVERIYWKKYCLANFFDAFMKFLPE